MLQTAMCSHCLTDDLDGQPMHGHQSKHKAGHVQITVCGQASDQKQVNAKISNIAAASTQYNTSSSTLNGATMADAVHSHKQCLCATFDKTTESNACVGHYSNTELHPGPADTPSLSVPSPRQAHNCTDSLRQHIHWLHSNTHDITSLPRTHRKPKQP